MVNKLYIDKLVLIIYKYKDVCPSKDVMIKKNALNNGIVMSKTNNLFLFYVLTISSSFCLKYGL